MRIRIDRVLDVGGPSGCKEAAKRCTESNRTVGPTLLLLVAAAWCCAIVAAPAFHLTFLYNIFSLICHQQPARSWQIAGEPLAVCVRCTSIYFGFLAALIVGLPANARLLRMALVATIAEFVFALLVVDSVALRSASGLALGASAAPFVRIGLSQLFPEAARDPM